MNTSGNLTNAPSMAELCAYFPAILVRILGRQDALTAGAILGSAYGAGAGEDNSWMFAA